jgi:hypothetical protein
MRSLVKSEEEYSADTLLIVACLLKATMTPNMLPQALTLLTSILQMSHSNLDRDTDDAD